MEKKRKTVIATAISMVVLIGVLSAVLLVGCNKANSSSTTTDSNVVSESVSDAETANIPVETEYSETEAQIKVDEAKKADETLVKEDVYIEEKDEKTGSSIELKYPVAQTDEFGEGADEYNKLIKDYMDVVTAQYKELVAAEDGKYSFKSDYEIYNKEDGYLSSLIKINISDGTQNITVYQSFNYDMNNKKQLVESPYVNCSNFDSKAKSLIQFDIEQKPSEYFSEVVSDFSSYYPYAKMVFDKNSVKFIYEPEYIADRSKGEKVFSYDNSKFED